MTYETVAAYSQISSMLVFIAVFIAVVAFAYWPGHEQKFDKEQRRALDLGADRKSIGGQ